MKNYLKRKYALLILGLLTLTSCASLVLAPVTVTPEDIDPPASLIAQRTMDYSDDPMIDQECASILEALSGPVGAPVLASRFQALGSAGMVHLEYARHTLADENLNLDKRNARILASDMLASGIDRALKPQPQ